MNDVDLRIAVVADIHACRPRMSDERVGAMIDPANSQKPDLTMLRLGLRSAERLGGTARSARGALGAYSILGNHDWCSAAIPTDPPGGSHSVRAALEAAGVPVFAQTRASYAPVRADRPARIVMVRLGGQSSPG